jgi:hypothetical protein
LIIAPLQRFKPEHKKGIAPSKRSHPLLGVVGPDGCHKSKGNPVWLRNGYERNRRRDTFAPAKTDERCEVADAAVVFQRGNMPRRYRHFKPG